MTNKEKALREVLQLDKAQKIVMENDYYRIAGTGEEYLVMTDEEADEAVKDYISDSVWAFNSDFIIEHSEALDFDEASKKVVEAIAELCENGNEAMKKLIDDFDEFVEDATSADGRGHFISGYDGSEEMASIGKEDYYIYRTN
jgi:hypothetical protein